MIKKVSSEKVPKETIKAPPKEEKGSLSNKIGSISKFLRTEAKALKGRVSKELPLTATKVKKFKSPK